MRVTTKHLLHASLLTLPFLSSCIPEGAVIRPGGSIIPPAPTAIVLVTPEASPGTLRQPVLRVEGVSPNHTVKLFTDSTCKTLVGSQNSTLTSVNITTNILNFGMNTFYATATNSDGGASACSTASATYRLIAKPSLSDIRDKVIDEDDELIIPFTASDADDLTLDVAPFVSHQVTPPLFLRHLFRSLVLGQVVL